MIFKFNEAQTKWLEALESGEYKQCKKALKKGDSYCCLGVGGVTLGLDELLEIGSSSFYVDIKDGLNLIGEMGQPKDIDLLPLYQLNDHQGKTFKQIAAHLREYPEQYFTGGADD
jgi:hypothetical protein